MRLVEQILVPPRSGKAFEVRKEQLLRVVLPEGPQFVDFDVFNRDNFKEYFSSSLTRVAEGAHPTTGTRLYSKPPWERVMFVITADTVRHEPNPEGTASHDLLYGRCTRKRRIERYGSDTPGCQEIIAAAIAEFGLAEEDGHPPLNIFFKTGIDKTGKLFFVESDAVAGDYVELRAEMNCLVAVSICPSGAPVLHPVSFEIYEA